MSGVGLGLFGDPYPGQLRHGHLLGFLTATTPDLALGQSDVLAHGEVREQVELLEDHAHLGSDLVDVGGRVGEVCTVDHDRALGGDLQKVDTAQHGGLA